jgi:response regulator of citrate/malate metabolism
MNQDTITKLKALAPSIEQFRNLQPQEQEWLLPCLHQTARTALGILDTITNQALTYEEIANICQLHPTSVKQILNALDDGGCRISLNEKTAFAPTGRPRNLARR